MKLTRARVGTGAALAVASVAILASAPAQYLGRQQDDLLYLIGSRSLLEGSFRLLTVPGKPPLSMINVGFPLLLAPVTLLAGDDFVWHQAFCALLLAACPWALWAWLKRRVEPLAALLIALCFACSPLVLSQAGTVMSEAPYLLMTIALLWALELKKAPYASAALAALTQTRLAAVSLIPAALTSKKRALALAPALAGLGLWTLWSRRAAGALQKTQELGLAYSGGIGRVFSVAADNARFYLASLGSCALPRSLGGGALPVVVGAAFCAAAALGCRARLRKDVRDPLVWALAGTAALHLLWPWQYERYWIMPLPLLLAAAAHGLGKARARAALGALLLGELVFHVPMWISHRGAWERPELAATYAWIKGHVAPGSLLSSALYVRDGYLAGLPSVPLSTARDARELSTSMKRLRAGWVLREDGLDLGLALPGSAPVARELASVDAALGDPSYFRLAYVNPEEHARVYQVR